MALLKLIRCKVAADKRVAFCTSQQAWQLIADCEGFIAQLGGWAIPVNNSGSDDTLSSNTGSDAIVLGMWQSEADLSQFMALEHDDIIEKSQQQASYLSCKVSRFNIIDISPTHATKDEIDVDIEHRLEHELANDSENKNENRGDTRLLQIIQFDGVIKINAFINSLTLMMNTTLQAGKPQETLSLEKPHTDPHSDSRSETLEHYPQCFAPLSVNLWQGAEDDACLLLCTLWHSTTDYQQYCNSAAYEQLQSQLSALCDSMQASVIKLAPLWDI